LETGHDDVVMDTEGCVFEQQTMEENTGGTVLNSDEDNHIMVELQTKVNDYDETVVENTELESELYIVSDQSATLGNMIELGYQQLEEVNACDDLNVGSIVTVDIISFQNVMNPDSIISSTRLRLHICICQWEQQRWLVHGKNVNS